ncbi:rho GTPase-activating protein gacZ-like [Anastrepha ludens]|uniref:rho GTPase-activating protein gacZ-like n=1 Tax=Anastrepha ludens TaxID=28586 RepID=UPI0023AFF67C|nr:rho GTPase-activating protein gacZ-like [Anastrepha ludens]XP_053965319.1 rho GTPase-activating protein gacZ-like [Anastrepha ludens]XP_053965329.1 rho GTPase-activating protein gacZ-like [Anastrepha ludens]XP_053965337.1 rho GTPase-activating protein gacZ-like [Anastrepha ludens]XP_053965345.1 rho GTPase-activating protein gacZ-like [Anastrepha ludens]
MRRNLRLYWRALALLGALLSIIIDWPGMMVYAMPASAAAAGQQQQQQARTMDTLSPVSALFAERAFHNNATGTTYRSGYSSNDNSDDFDGGSGAGGSHIVSDKVLVNDNFSFNSNLNTNRNSSNSSNYSESEQRQQQQQQEEAPPSTEDLPKSSRAQSVTALGANASSKRSSASVGSDRSASASHEPAPHAPPTSRGDLLHNAQRIKVLNLISNKRKRKKFSDESSGNEAAAYAVDAAVVASSSNTVVTHHSATTDRQARSSDAAHDITRTTTANTPLSFSENSISNKYLIKNNNLNNQNQQMAVAPKRTLNKLETTTIATATTSSNKLKANIKNDNYINYIEEEAVEEGEDVHSAVSNDYQDESSSSTSLPYSFTAAPLSADEAVLDSSYIAAAAAPPSPAFTFASAHHTAILLSRTERSVRQPESPSSSQADAVEQAAPAGGSTSATLAGRRAGGQVAVRHHGGANGGGIVRRSSDGSPKTRRLNNFRNSNVSRHLPSNLDRNERSTISHLSGLARKIQIYIKNRFIQLLPDGTVNGTQDEQSDYSKFNKNNNRCLNFTRKFINFKFFNLHYTRGLKINQPTSFLNNLLTKYVFVY